MNKIINLKTHPHEICINMYKINEEYVGECSCVYASDRNVRR